MVLFGMGFSGVAVGKNPSANVGDSGSTSVPEDPLEEEMATHSSILAWRIPWTEEPGRLQSIYGLAKSQIQLSN